MLLTPRRAGRAALPVFLALPLVVLAACSSGGGEPAAGGPSSSGPTSSAAPSSPPRFGSPGSSPPATTGGATAATDDVLQVEVDPGDGSAAKRYELSCAGSPGGTLPDAAAACTHLAALADPFAPLPTDVACSQVFSGPQKAHVTGRWHGGGVDLRLSRTDGCRTAQWDSLGPLLPGALR
jgi:hypothetical protein